MNFGRARAQPGPAFAMPLHSLTVIHNYCEIYLAGDIIPIREPTRLL